MIRIEDIELRRGIKVLLKHASCNIAPGERVGLVGPNGCGKSSLFALLRGEVHADAGDVSMPPQWRVGYVAQHDLGIADSALAQVLAGDVVLRDLKERIDALDGAEDADSGLALAEALQHYQEAGGYSAKARAESLLLGLGFSLEETARPVDSFSGGWRMRIALARALMNPADLLLLDEPTNHLDLDAIVWLEQWLKRYTGTLIVISHDREFLDSVCKSIVAIADQGLSRYGGNYSAFELQRAEQRRQSHFAWEKQQRDIAHLRHFIDRFKAKASKARQAQSRVKALERMELLAPAHLDSPFSFRFATPERASDPMLKLEHATCGYHTQAGTRVILEGVHCELRNGDRIGLLGANGQGKSTLIKTLAGVLPPLTDSLHRPPNLAIGYFAQHQIESLRADDTPLRHLSRIAPNEREQSLRDYLGRFDFGAEAAKSPVGPFSGGEKARLALALLIYQRPNLLLLDEPTNHLDLETRDALVRALAEYEGTMVLVAHDRALLRATADRFWLVHGGKVAPFDGDLDDYRDWLLERSKEKDPSLLREPAPSTVVPPTARLVASDDRRQERKDTAQLRQAHALQRKPLESRLRRIETQLAKLNAERDTLKTRLADPSFYTVSTPDAIRQTTVDEAYLAREIATLEDEWLAQQSELEQLGVAP